MCLLVFIYSSFFLLDLIGIGFGVNSSLRLSGDDKMRSKVISSYLRLWRRLRLS